MSNIQKLRERAKFTQKNLAEKLGVGQSTVAMWESGAQMPRADKLPEIAKILGCTIDELFEDQAG